MNGGSGKYVQDNYAGHERETQDGGTIERLPEKEPGDKRYEHDAGARPDSVCDFHRQDAQGKGEKEESNGIARHDNY